MTAALLARHRCSVPPRARAAPSPRRGEAGMTLVELIVALVLVSLISAAIASGLRLGVSATKRQEQTGGAQMEIALAQAALRRLIEAARPMTGREGNGAPHVLVSGAKDSVTFVVELPHEFGFGGLYEATLAAQESGGTTHLVARFRPHPPQGTLSEAAHETFLVEGIEGVSFRYFWKANDRETAAWETSWSDQRALPRLVSLSVAFSGGDGRRWTELIARPRLGEARVP